MAKKKSSEKAAKKAENMNLIELLTPPATPELYRREKTRPVFSPSAEDIVTAQVLVTPSLSTRATSLLPTAETSPASRERMPDVAARPGKGVPEHEIRSVSAVPVGRGRDEAPGANSKEADRVRRDVPREQATRQESPLDGTGRSESVATKAKVGATEKGQRLGKPTAGPDIILVEDTPAGIVTAIPAHGSDSFEEIRRDAEACKQCELYKTRQNLVFGVGPENARLVFVGEAPGADEDETGIPFVGRAGQHFDKILAAAGFDRNEVYICNILKCRPPNNRTPTPLEMKACTSLLQRQLQLIQPQLLACLGNTAIKYLIGPDTPGITKIRGQWFTSIFGIPVMAMYHPSYLLRYPARTKGSPNWEMWQDIQSLKRRFDELRDS